MHIILFKPVPIYQFVSIMSNEAYFYLHSLFNKQNNRIWSKESRFKVFEVSLNILEFLVLCEISASHIFETYFFSSAVNHHAYLEMLNNFFCSKLIKTRDYKKYYFQQDRAPSHMVNEVQSRSTKRFGEKFIDSKKCPHA